MFFGLVWLRNLSFDLSSLTESIGKNFYGPRAICIRCQSGWKSRRRGGERDEGIIAPIGNITGPKEKKKKVGRMERSNINNEERRIVKKVHWSIILQMIANTSNRKMKQLFANKWNVLHSVETHGIIYELQLITTCN